MKWGVGILFTLFCFWAEARTSPWHKDFVRLRSGQKIYTEYRAALNGKPTLFLANGLTWSTTDWAPYVKALDNLDPELGFVLYDMRGMGKTLLEYAPILEPITIDQQTEDLKNLREALNVEGKTILVGLSYGGAETLAYMARYPNDFDNGIAFAPFIERLPDQDQLINRSISSHRMLYPWDLRSNSELYDFYLQVLVFSTYPMAEPVLLENPYKLPATFRMVQGAKNFNAFALASQLPINKIHLIGAMDDEFVKDDRLQKFWEAIKGRGASYLRLKNTRHKIPSQRSQLAANWTLEIIRSNPEIMYGRAFVGDPIEGKARSDDGITIPLTKVSSCEYLLQRTLGSF